jgi:hypothetical protein
MVFPLTNAGGTWKQMPCRDTGFSSFSVFKVITCGLSTRFPLRRTWMAKQWDSFGVAAWANSLGALRQTNNPMPQTTDLRDVFIAPF